MTRAKAKKQHRQLRHGRQRDGELHHWEPTTWRNRAGECCAWPARPSAVSLPAPITEGGWVTEDRQLPQPIRFGCAITCITQLTRCLLAVPSPELGQIPHYFQDLAERHAVARLECDRCAGAGAGRRRASRAADGCPSLRLLVLLLLPGLSLSLLECPRAHLRQSGRVCVGVRSQTRQPSMLSAHIRAAGHGPGSGNLPHGGARRRGRQQMARSCPRCHVWRQAMQ